MKDYLICLAERMVEIMKQNDPTVWKKHVSRYGSEADVYDAVQESLMDREHCKDACNYLANVISKNSDLKAEAYSLFMEISKWF